MYFPLFVDLSKKEILVIGAGTIGTRRIRTLCRFAGHITVVSVQISEEVKALAGQYPITLVEEPFRQELLAGADLVLAASDDRELNREIALLCRKQSIPVNISSEKEECDFYFPSVVVKDDIVIGLNASGQNHRKVKETRMELEEYLKQ